MHTETLMVRTVRIAFFFCVVAHTIFFLLSLYREKTCKLHVRTTKGADKPAYPRSLINAFNGRYLEAIITQAVCKNPLFLG